jgi:SAM-dependent MidA family methyltransferase
MSHLVTLQAELRRQIASHGPIPFFRFMEMALYAPGLGYYERERAVVGRRGDFYTSVSVGNLFGELLARQFADWIRLHPDHGTAPVLARLVEGGAHDGELAADILGWMDSHEPALSTRLEYWIIEPSARRRAWQEERLARFAPRVQWADGHTCIPRGSFRITFCNELLDAMPVHRLGWDASTRGWFEWGVDWHGGHFVWARIPLAMNFEPGGRCSIPALGWTSEKSPAELRDLLPDGYTIEVCPAAVQWWAAAASTLDDGILLAIDYGLTDEERFLPGREHGTLRAIRKHHLVDNVLAHPGEQDLTAHVDFCAIQRAGEAAGLKTLASTSQSQFLTAIMARIPASSTVPSQWTSSHTRQFQTLVHPEHLGRAFRVLVQASGSALAVRV